MDQVDLKNRAMGRPFDPVWERTVLVSTCFFPQIYCLADLSNQASRDPGVWEVEGCMALVGIGFAAKEGRTTPGRVGLVALHVLGQVSVAAVVVFL